MFGTTHDLRVCNAKLLHQLHEANPIVTLSLPAIRRPDPYQNWTRFATSEQTMIYQDTPRCVGLHFDRMDQGAIIIIPFGLDHKEGTRHRSLR